MNGINKFPRQYLPFSKKNKDWRRNCVKWAENSSVLESSLVRKTVKAKKINYDLLNGKLDVKDMQRILNPHNLEASFIPDAIQHYPILNSKLNVLRGEEANRTFDYKVVITNPNALTEIAEQKKEAVFQNLLTLIKQENLPEEQFNAEVEKLADFFQYSWSDIRELRGNYLLNHYEKELNFPLIFNSGFVDAMTVGEEIYKCDIISGEPIIEKLDPTKVRIFKSGRSNKIEDADIIVLEDYWSPSRVIDTYYEHLTPQDIKKLDDSDYSEEDSMGTIDEREGFINARYLDINTTAGDAFYSSLFSPDANNTYVGLPYDIEGNVRVLNVYWKSKRKVKKVKFFDPETGEERYDIFPETYKADTSLGQEEKILWINEAWEGTLIGKDIYLNIRPRPIQYNRLSNPSKCHFGIIGSVYNINSDQPFSLVDMMKPYSYLYNAVHDKLNKLISANWGKIITIDLAKIPKGWDIDKWLYFAKTNNIAVVDSFKEGNIGAATGKLAGGLNNNTSGVIDAEMGNHIQANLQLLEYIKNEMSEAIGISKQREGQIQNRETVGGVERSTLQSTHITEWLFFIHESVKKRALECFLETAKIAITGDTLKFQHILPDNSRHISMIDGDQFAEMDYGLLVDSSKSTRELGQKIDMLAQAALQNQLLNFSTIMKLYSSASFSEKQKYIEKNEAKIQQQQQEQMQQQQQMQQEQMQAQMQQLQAQQEFQERMNTANNETRIRVAEIQAEANLQRDYNQAVFRIDDDAYSEEEKEDMARKKQEFSDKMALEREKLAFQRESLRQNINVKEKAIKVQKENKQQTNK